MSAPNQNGFLLLYSGDEWYKRLSKEELEKASNDARVWVERLMAQGKAKGGLVLERKGAVVSGNSKRVFSDGPFAESKEVIGGTLLLDVATMEEAIAIARTSPSLAYNTTIEVRPIGNECPLEACAREMERQAQLTPP